MSDFEQPVYIKMRTALNFSAVDIHTDLVNVHQDSAYAYRTVAKWVSLFKAGRESIEDDPRSGRPVTATSPTEIELIKRLIEEDRFITYDQMEEQSSLSHGTINRMIHDHLGLRKLASRWVPHQLSAKNRQDRLNFCKEMLGRIESGQVRLDQIVTGDECWIYFRQIAKRASSRAWTAPGQAPPTIVKRGLYEKKCMFVVFFRTTGPVLVHCLEKGKTIDHRYYIDKCLSPMVARLKEQRPKSGTRGIKLLHDNARPHVASATREFIRSSGIELLGHPAYSPDLAPCDYYLFDFIKQRLGDVDNQEQLLQSVTAILTEMPRQEYFHTFEKYVERLKHCISVEGDYFEHLI